MADFIIEELQKLGLMIGFGIAMAVVYDVFRILRRIIPHNFVAVSTEDLIFWLGLGIPAFYFVLLVNDGEFRLYFILGILLGIFVYRETVSRLIMFITELIVGKIRKFVIFMLKKKRKRIKIENSTKEP